MTTEIRTVSETFLADFDLQQVVYLRIREEPIKGVVTCIHVTPLGLDYEVTWDNCQAQRHYEFELTDTPPF